ncbi:MAG: hypothetical protein E6H65_08160 [Betaproteobacteria bacterium]|nr:MAG: hypothetical protein E6H65_08160 [Betaproteobacteria bacterium]
MREFNRDCRASLINDAALDTLARKSIELQAGASGALDAGSNAVSASASVAAWPSSAAASSSTALARAMS